MPVALAQNFRDYHRDWQISHPIAERNARCEKEKLSLYASSRQDCFVSHKAAAFLYCHDFIPANLQIV